MPRKSRYIRSKMDVVVKKLLKNKYDIDVAITQDGSVRGFPNSDDNQMHNKYLVTLSSRGRTYTYPFYGSVHSFSKREDPSTWEMVEAKISDALFLDGEAIDSAEELAEVYGDDYYDNPQRYDRIFRELEDSRDKLERLGLSEDDLYNISNQIRDWEDQDLYRVPVDA